MRLRGQLHKKMKSVLLRHKDHILPFNDLVRKVYGGISTKAARIEIKKNLSHVAIDLESQGCGIVCRHRDTSKQGRPILSIGLLSQPLKKHERFLEDALEDRSKRIQGHLNSFKNAVKVVTNNRLLPQTNLVPVLESKPIGLLKP